MRYLCGHCKVGMLRLRRSQLNDGTPSYRLECNSCGHRTELSYQVGTARTAEVSSAQEGHEAQPIKMDTDYQEAEKEGSD